MAPSDAGPGIPDKDALIADRLGTWLNNQKHAWLDAATRETEDPPSVPNVGQATEINELTEILSSRAIAIGYNYRQYLTSDRNLANLAVIDVLPDYWEERNATVLDPEIIRKRPTTLEHLIPGTDDVVVDEVTRIMEKFRLFHSTDDPGRSYGIVTQPPGTTEPIQKQLSDVGIFADGRIRHLIFEDFDSATSTGETPTDRTPGDDATIDILPPVSDGIYDHISALLTEDPETIRKMEYRLPLADDGRSVSNDFKVVKGWSEGLFTGNATVGNIGDPNVDADSFTNRTASDTNLLHVTEAEIVPDKWGFEGGIDEERSVITVEERLARYERLNLLHTLGQDDTYEDNPGVLGSVLHHLLRFGLIRCRLSARARHYLLNIWTDDYIEDDDPDDEDMLSRKLRKTLVDHDVPVGGMRPDMDVRRTETSVTYDDDPRVGQLMTSLRYLQDVPEDELERLLRETLDLASHRFDAWWTSLATRQLAELRNDQDNWYVRKPVDYRYWGGSVPYVRPSENASELVEEYVADTKEQRENDHRIQPTWKTEEQRLDAVIDALETFKSKLGTDDYDGSSFQSLKQAHREYFNPSGTSIDYRRTELEYLNESWAPPGSGERPNDFFGRAAVYVGSQPESETEPNPDDSGYTGHGDRPETESLGEYLNDVQWYVNQGPSDYGTHDWYRDKPTDSLEEVFELASGPTDKTDLVTHLTEVFKIARRTAEAEAPDSQPTDEIPVDPGLELPDENESGVQVGAWGYVEDLHADGTGRNRNIDQSEYIHAPSMEQATTAAILRGGHEAFQAQDDASMSAIDLSPDRVRIARRLLDGVREGQPLGALLGYRFERALHEVGAQQYIHDFREAYPAFTGTLGGPDESETAARSDVVDGYALYRSLTFDGVDESIQPEAPDRPGTKPPESQPPDYRDKRSEYDLPPVGYTNPNLVTEENSAVEDALWHLFDAVDALRDLLTAESVHQFAQGNYSRAKASLDALAAGDALPDPQVIETPRTETGLTNRLLVTFGDASANTPEHAATPELWRHNTRLAHPKIPAVDRGEETLDAIPASTSQDGKDGFRLQSRAVAEPNLNAWVGDLLPDPGEIGCEAEYRWSEQRTFATGSFTTPKEDGTVSVTDVGFEPDVIVLTASTAVEGIGPKTSTDGSDQQEDASGQGTYYGWTHGKYQRDPDGGAVQNSVSLGYNTAADGTAGTADTGHALNVVLQPPKDSSENSASITGTVTETTEEGFELSVATDRDRSVAVEYVAFTTGDLSAVEVGTFLTPTGTGTQTESLGIDADSVSLTATDLFDPSNLGDDDSITQTATGATGFSHGEAVGSSSVDQHAVSITHDPGGSGSPEVGAREGSAIYLPSTLEAEVTKLGEDLELDYTTNAGSTPRLVTYVAVGTGDDERGPKIGVVGEGENEVVGEDETFTPACIEFVAVPGLDGGFDGGSGTTGTPATAGWSRGVATGPGRGRVVHHSVEPGASVEAASSIENVVSVSTGDARITATLDSIDERGFTVGFPDGKPDDVLVLYRAWPKEPTEREHAVPATLALEDLALSPLDALFFSKNADGGRTQLEERIAYYLHRNTGDAVESDAKPHAPIPPDATIELTLRAAGDASMAVAEVLEVLGTLRDMVTEGQAADADDFAPPAERAGPGYDEKTHSKLAQRADAAHGALEDVERQIDNRIEVLDPTPPDDQPDADPPNVCDQVDDVQDALDEFRDEVPVSGIEAASERIDAATDDVAGILASELEAVWAALPAGPTGRAAADESIVVEALTGRTISGTAEVSGTGTLEVRILGTTGADTVSSGSPAPLEKSATVTHDEGAFEASFDFDDVTPGMPFVAVGVESDAVVFSATGRVVEPATGIALDPPDAGSSDRTIEGVAAVDGKTTITVAIDADVASGSTSPSDSTSVDTDPDGSFDASLDVSGASPRTAVTVTATDSADETVYEASGYVRDPAADRNAADVVADLTVLPRLLWLARERPAIDPTETGSPAHELEKRLDDADWSAIRREADLIDRWERQLDEQSTTVDDAAITDDDVGQLASLKKLDDVDLSNLATAIADALEPIETAGIPDAIDVTGGHDRIDDARFWQSADVEKLERTRTALAQVRRNPAAVGMDADDLRYAPEFVTFVEESGTSGSWDGIPERLFEYLDVLFAETAWFVGEFADPLDRPDEFVEHLREVASYPERFDANDTRTELDAELDTLVDHYATLDVPALYATLERAEELAAAIERDRQVPGELIEIVELLEEMAHPNNRSEEELVERVDRIRDRLGDLRKAGIDSSYEARFERLVVAVEDLEDELAAAEPWVRFDRLNERFEDVRPDETRLTIDGRESGEATHVTEFVYLLGQLRTGLSRYETELGSASAADVYRPADARSGFKQWWATIASTLGSEVSTEVAPLVDPRRSARLNETFRRCVLETLRVPMLRASYFGVTGSTPQFPVGRTKSHEETLVGQARSVRSRLDERLASADDHREAANGLADEAENHQNLGTASIETIRRAYEEAAEHELARLEALFDDEIEVLPPLSPPNQPEISRTLSKEHNDKLLSEADPMETETWLQRTARVRERPALFRESLSYAEMLTGELIRDDLRVGQLPYRNSDDWAGLEAVTPERGQVSLVTHFATKHDEDANQPVAPNPGTSQAQQGNQVAALRVDEWRTSVPAESETTGVALNYDDPNVEPPQSILLAVLPDEESWSAATLVRTVLETIELSKVRGVDLHQLGKPREDGSQRDLGHYLPALTFPLNTNDRPDVPSVDFKLDEVLAEQLLYDGEDETDGGDGS